MRQAGKILKVEGKMMKYVKLGSNLNKFRGNSQVQSFVAQ